MDQFQRQRLPHDGNQLLRQRAAQSVTDTGDANNQYDDYYYTYDSIGRVLAVDSVYTTGSGSTTENVILTASYDKDGDRTSLSANIGGALEVDGNSVTVSGGADDFQNAYTYNDLNEMIEVAKPANAGKGKTANVVTAKSAAFGYDADGEYKAMGLFQDANVHTTDPTDTTDRVSRATYG